MIEQNKEAYSNLDNDTRKLLEVVAKVKIKEEEVMESSEKKYDLCKAFVDMKKKVGNYDVEQICTAMMES